MKIITYTVLDCREFDQLVKEHLGVAIQDEENDWNTKSFNFQQKASWQPLNQDTYSIFDWETVKETEIEIDEEDGMKYQEAGFYVRRLYELGVFPKEYPIFVKVWW